MSTATAVPRVSTTWTPRARTPLTARHVLNRLGCGWSLQDEALVTAAGGPAAWVNAQLDPGRVTESGRVAEVDQWFAYLRDSPSERIANLFSGARPPFVYAIGLGNWTILRRIYSRRPLLETMTDFWSDHFNVPVTHDQAWLHRFEYDATIRRLALGRFEDLLKACSLHPSMRYYLDNWLSRADDPNENQGRELLELHTVGRSAGYTEDMVKDSARILSGYTMDWGTTFAAYYDPARHSVGPVSVLGFHHDNAGKDGQALASSYLSYLAHHPATARHLARKLAVFFVSDTPSDGLVEALAATYLRSGTDISAVLRALVRSTEFLVSAGKKVRRPIADLVATAKVLGVEVKAPTGDSSWANQASNLHGGDRLFAWPTPDGPPVDDPRWSSAGRVAYTLRMHFLQTGAYYPTVDVAYRPPSALQPTTDTPYPVFVDRLCRQLLGKPADTRLAAVGAQALQGFVGATVGPSRPLDDFLLMRLVNALIDTPDHMNR